MEDIRAAYRNLRRHIRIANLRGGSLVESVLDQVCLSPYVVPRGDASTNPRLLTRVYYNIRHIFDGCPLREQEKTEKSTHPVLLISSQVPSAPSGWYR